MANVKHFKIIFGGYYEQIIMKVAIYLIIHILFSLGMFISLKLISEKRADRTLSILINYIIAALLTYADLELSYSDWWFSDKFILPAAIVALLFVVTFFIMSLSAEKAGIGITTALNKMSVLIPVIVGILFLGQDSELLSKLLGLLLSIIAFALIFQNKAIERNKGYYILPVLVFVLSGLIDTSMELSHKFYVKIEYEREVFLLALFVFAVFFSFSALIIKNIISAKDSSIRKEGYTGRRKWINVIKYGSLLGVFNFLTSKMILVNVGALGGSFVYPIHNSSVVALTALSGFLFFKERLSAKQWTGLFLAAVGVSLIASVI
jgi:drug/metabolite transporter (DMT)-like permease